MTQISDNIRKIRTERRMTQGELAEQLGVHQSYIAQIERGTKIPNMIIAKELARTLNVTLERLYKGEQ